MKLVYYRIFVAKTSQLSFFDDVKTTKPELIEKAFSSITEPIHFSFSERKYAYVIQKIAPPYIYATLAKQSDIKIQRSPEEGFETDSVESWPNVPIIINFDGNESTGQSIAVELNKQVFEHPHVQIRSLISVLNSKILKNLGYEMALNPITAQSDFWQAINDNEGDLKSVEFEFAAPNLFGTKDSLNDELRDARDSFHMTKASVKLENSEGELKVPESNNFINEGIKYIADGGGKYTLKLTHRRTITSEESIQSKEIEEVQLEIAAKNEETLKDFCDKLFLWLKR